MIRERISDQIYIKTDDISSFQNSNRIFNNFNVGFHEDFASIFQHNTISKVFFLLIDGCCPSFTVNHFPSNTVHSSEFVHPNDLIKSILYKYYSMK